MVHGAVKVDPEGNTPVIDTVSQVTTVTSELHKTAYLALRGPPELHK